MTLSDSDLARSRRGSVGRGLAGFVDFVAKTGVVLGGLFAAWQYWEAKTAQRVERTMEYIVRYEDGRVGEARRRIDQGLRAHLHEFREIAAVGISQADRDELVLTIVEENNGQIANDIDVVVDFFEGLSTCTENDLCDVESAEKYFAASEAGVLESNFEPYFALRRANNPNYASALQRFAGEAS